MRAAQCFALMLALLSAVLAWAPCAALGILLAWGDPIPPIVPIAIGTGFTCALIFLLAARV